MHRKHKFLLLLPLALALAACATGSSTNDAGANPGENAAALPGVTEPAEAPLRLTSLAFADGENIPQKYVCTRQGGENVSPALVWENVPAAAASLALLVHDPHPTAQDWVHWVVADISPQRSGLPEGVPVGTAVSPDVLPGGATQYVNRSGSAGYAGPCPPDPPHPYVFTLYALRAAPAWEDGMTYAQLRDALEGLVITSASLTGQY